MIHHTTYINKIFGYLRQSVVLTVMILFITPIMALDDQTSATPPSKMAELFFSIDTTCSNAKEATDIVLNNKDIILEKLEQKFPTIPIWFKDGNPTKPFEGSVKDRTARFNEIDFIFKHMSVSEYLSTKVIFPSENTVYLCNVPMVLKGHSCLVTKKGEVLLNYYPKFEAVAEGRTAYGTVIYSDFTAYLSGSPALYFWFWIDTQGNIYTLPK